MNRFDALFTQKKTIFMPFFTLGDPDFDQSWEMIETAIDAGADCLELGIAFSDPIADGPTNQRSMQRAIESGVDFERALEMLRKIRQKTATLPISLLLYYNLLYRRGLDKAFSELAAVGVDAVVSADLPLEESAAFESAATNHGVGVVHIIAPNTPDARAVEIFERCSAYTYVLSGYGTTGVKSEIDPRTLDRVKHLRELTKKPMIVGFGISKTGHVKAVWQAGAEGAIVGSYFTQLIENHLAEPQKARAMVSTFIQDLS